MAVKMVAIQKHLLNILSPDYDQLNGRNVVIINKQLNGYAFLELCRWNTAIR
jgi:hypothetical protein